MNIAVAIDGSDNAFRAAKHAIMMAKHMPYSVLQFIYVIDYDKVKNEWLLSQSPASSTLHHEKIFSPALALANKNAIQADTVILKGTPSHELIKYVNEHEIAQLILGSRGLNKLQEMVLGSVSHKVMKHVKCPVTIVK